MTSFINLPATYFYKHSQSSGLYSVYYEGEMIGQSFSKDECEWMAKKHYNKQENTNV